MTEAAFGKMNCMEVWGGNRSTWSHFQVPGLDLWVYSRPAGVSLQGGDVYYVSSCASGRITRMLLADVSGHGIEASPIAGALRDMMRKNINFIDQSRLVESLNEQFQDAASEGRFATAVISSFFAPTRTLTVCTAGHPPPIVFRTAAGSWSVLDDSGQPVAGNLPFGIVGGQKFASTRLRLQVGDMLLCYTDACYEAVDAQGRMLRAEGIAALASEIDPSSSEFIPQLLNAVATLNPANLTTDDTTMILARANREGVPLRNSLLAPLRLLGSLVGYYRRRESSSLP